MNAAIKIAAQQKIEPGEVQSVRALIAHQGVQLVCEPLAARRAPADSYAAQFSLPYTIACCLLRGEFGLTDLEDARLKDARTLELAGKMEYEVDPNAGFPKSRSGEVIVTMRDGRRLQQRENILPDEPIAEEEVVAKFYRNAEMAMSRTRAAQIEAAILGIDNEPNVARVVTLLGNG